MNKDHRQRLLVQVAKLYYEEGLGQEKIAKMMDLSRPYVSKLLNAAREEGIVRIHVIDPLNIESPLEAEFRERFHLRKAIIVQKDTGSEPLQHIGETTARFINEILEDDSVIGTCWGTTVFECSKALIPRSDLHNLLHVQLCGGVSNLNQTVYANHIAEQFSNALGAKSLLLPVPAVVESKEVADLLMNDGSVFSILQKGIESDIALFTGGAFGHRNALYRAGYLGEGDLKELSAKGAVGDVASHIIDKNGELCDRELDARTLSVPFESLKNIDWRICVGQGYSKVDCLTAVLRSGICNVLITNEETAGWILERTDR